MKNLFILGLFILALVFVQFAQAQTVDEVINNHIKSLGGKENLQKIQNIVMQGGLSVQGAEIAMTFTQVNNKLSRQDIHVMGMTGYDFITDKEGWSFMPFQGMQKPEPKTADEVKTLESGSFIQMDTGERHRLIGLDSWGVVAEIWLHTDAANPSDEDDIVRLQDDFGR